MQPGEPSWLPDDTAYALAWQAELDAKCDGCGHPRDETMNSENEGAYTASPLRCHACAEQAKTAKAWADGSGEREGLYFTVQRR